MRVALLSTTTSRLLCVWATVVCTALGSGLLSMGGVFQEAGLVVALLLVVGFSCAASYAVYALSSIACELKERDPDWNVTYAGIAEHVFGSVGKWFIFVSFALTCFMVSVIFIVIGGTELQQLFEQSGTWYMFGPEGTDSAHKVWMTLFWAVACSPPLLFRGMSDLGWVSVWGGMASVIVGLIVVVSVSTVGAPAGADTSIVMVPESFSSALVAIGAIATSYGAANQVPSLTGETPRKLRKHVPVAAAAGLLFCAAIYIMVGMAAYLVYGTSIKPPGSDGNVLSQLPAGAATYTALALITSHVLVAFGLLLQPLLIQVEMGLGLPSPYAQTPEGSPLADPKVGLENGNDDEENVLGRSFAASTSASSSLPAPRHTLSAPRMSPLSSLKASTSNGISEDKTMGMRKRSWLSLDVESGRARSVSSDVTPPTPQPPKSRTEDTSSFKEPSSSLSGKKGSTAKNERSLMRKNTLSWGQTFASLAIRFTIMALALFFALLIPFFGDLLTLTGAFMVTSSCYYFPLMIYCKYYWKQLGWPEIVLLFTLFAAGIFVTIGGTITGVEAIVANSATYQLF